MIVGFRPWAQGGVLATMPTGCFRRIRQRGPGKGGAGQSRRCRENLAGNHHRFALGPRPATDLRHAGVGPPFEESADPPTLVRHPATMLQLVGCRQAAIQRALRWGKRAHRRGKAPRARHRRYCHAEGFRRSGTWDAVVRAAGFFGVGAFFVGRYVAKHRLNRGGSRIPQLVTIIEAGLNSPAVGAV